MVKDSKEKDLDKFLNVVGRTPRMDVHMRLASKKLLHAATLKNGLERYDLIIRAGYTMLKECEEKGFKVELGRLVILDNLVQSFLASKEDEVDINGFRYKIQTIPWSFPPNQEMYEAYILEWWNGSLDFIPDLLREQKEVYVKLNCGFCGVLLCDVNYEEMLAKVEDPKKSWFHPNYDEVEYNNRCPVCKNSFSARNTWQSISYMSQSVQPLKITYYYRPITEPEWKFFFDATMNALTPNGYQQLLSNFLGYYNQEISEIESKIAKSIDPTIFKEVSMEMQTEARKHENSMA